MGKEYAANIKKQGSNNQYVQKSEKPEKQVLHEKGATSYKVAELYGVGHDAVEKNGQLAKSIDKIGEFPRRQRKKFYPAKRQPQKKSCGKSIKKRAKKSKKSPRRLKPANTKSPSLPRRR